MTSEDARIAVDGSHTSRRTNPHGIEFEIGCFAAAPGAHAVGPPTGDHTWFRGHVWRIAGCCGCGTHLGWSFDAPGSAFWGLILDRLTHEA